MPAELDRSRLDMALRLLAKAGRTSSGEEAVALAQKCYRLLAEQINQYEDAIDASPVGLRKRERRLLRDRRRGTSAINVASTVPRREQTFERYRQAVAADVSSGGVGSFDVRL